MSTENCPGFEELFRAAKGRSMTETESDSYGALSQKEKNALVKEWVAESGGKFVWEDQAGTDGIIYTAFRHAEPRR
jgi:hypothetical protein